MANLKVPPVNTTTRHSVHLTREACQAVNLHPYPSLSSVLNQVLIEWLRAQQSKLSFQLFDKSKAPAFSLVGTYSTLEEAKAAADSLDLETCYIIDVGTDRVIDGSNGVWEE